MYMEQKRKERTGIIAEVDLMGDNTDHIIGGPGSRPHYIRKSKPFL